jgi:hypothetical protein
MNNQTFITGFTGLAGLVLGFFLNYLKTKLENKAKGKRYYYASSLQLIVAIEKIGEKITWISRDISHEDIDVEKKLTVHFDNSLLYLGEHETFKVDLAFWDKNLSNIVKVTDFDSFSLLFNTVKQIKKFEIKFKEMKIAFKVHVGNSKEIALQCYKDLVRIYGDLSLMKNRLYEKILPADKE